MRPLALTMTAFGPFPGTETVLFARLGDNPLFLINGPTGAGKTTILDAICFALYGKTTGDEREGSQMRADLAAAELMTEVTLVFELAGRHYRIRRVPEQQKPKSRGQGTTTQSPEAQLWRLDRFDEQQPFRSQPENEQLLVASKVTEASREIEQLTGLNADQFRQVMVLPQGKFRQLLMADSRQREQIFSQLFQTHVYQQLEERLKSQSAAVRQQVEKQRQRMQGILASCDLDSQQALTSELDALQPQLLRAKDHRQQQQAQLQQANEVLQRARQLDQAFQQLAGSRAELQQLEQQTAAIDGQRRQLSDAEQGQKLSPLYQHLQRSSDEHKQLQQQYQDAETQHRQAANQLQQAEQQRQGCAQLQQQLDNSKQQRSTLVAYSSRASELRQAQQRQQQAGARAQQRRQALEQAQAALEALLVDREQVEQRQQALQQRLAILPDLSVRLEQLTESLQQARQLEQLDSQQQQQQRRVQQAEMRGKQLKARYQAEQTSLKTLELRWHQGQAALLARELQHQQPCPVCGSLDHPQPAFSEESVPSQAELQQARDRSAEAHQQLIDAREDYLAKQKDLEHLRQQAIELRQRLGATAATAATAEAAASASELAVGHTQLQQQVQALRVEQHQNQQLLQQLQQLKLQEAERRQQLQAAQQQTAEQQALLAAADSQLSRAEAELPAAYRQVGALEAAISQAETHIADQHAVIEGIQQQYQRASEQWHSSEARLKTLLAQVQQAQLGAEQAAEAWRLALATSPFASQTDYQAALRSEQQTQQLKLSIQRFDRRCAELQGAIAQQQSLLAEQQPPDLGALQQQLQNVQSCHDQAQQQWQRLDRRVEQLRATEQKLQQAQAQLLALEDRYRLVGTLSDVANGQTGNKISLQRFVLSVLLDDVLIEASRRLNLMSKGRYQLLRKALKAKGNKASGLELEVEDAYTGKVRAVATLSGGESFMAALSMALGLSDVVQAYAGGIRLDTLFIDEGFGSLDPESLDLAVRTLIDLQASGRMVGVISHVAELKEQMPLRLDVISGREGSEIRLVTP